MGTAQLDTYRPDKQEVWEVQVFTPEDDSGHAENASYAAYNEGVRAAYRALSASLTDYFSENPGLYKNEVLEVPENFRPLKDYERALKIQKLALRLALGTAQLSEHKVANSIGLPVHSNGRGPLPVMLALPPQ
jgi:hypothetical protein